MASAFPNEGEVHLNPEAPNGSGPALNLRSTFQAARVTRPLMSVSKICGHGFKCVFDDKEALIIDNTGVTQCRFERKGGLYLAKMRLKAPMPFQGQAP